MNEFSFEYYPPKPTAGMLTGDVPVGIKVTHIPTGIFVVCDTERTQLKNRDLAVKQLIEKLSNK